ncbi:Plastocyanin-like domain [Musa troglodytarum]|uniref:Plastocyanin-like domain n=1 Tax=Musa troglodytarum TaxID=320322 RepID=A0A9E7K1E9_9LILI|nr:Plastocyanin-like domain [Musa troglodytarum]
MGNGWYSSSPSSSACNSAVVSVPSTVAMEKGWWSLSLFRWRAWASRRERCIQLLEVVFWGLHRGWALDSLTFGAAFEYDKAEHNVVEMTLADYHSCSAANPIGVYSAGKDTIKIYRLSHRFFICGRAKDCQAGQKVNIRVPKAASSSLPPSVPPSHPPTVHPSPPASGSPALQHAGWSSALAAVICATVFFLVG